MAKMTSTRPPAPPVADIVDASVERRRYRKLLVLAGLLFLLLSLLAVLYYLAARPPLTALPAVGPLTRAAPPRFLFAIYDVARPVAIALSVDQQRLYVAESEGERLVRIFDRAGRPLGVLAPPAPFPGRRVPAAVAVDPAGQVLVADGLQSTVFIYDGDDALPVAMLPPGEDAFFAPLGLSFDRAGRLYAADAAQGRQRVLVYDAQRQVQLALGKPGRGLGELSFPAQAVAHGGRIFVADSNNSRVAVFRADGAPLLSFGQGGKGEAIALGLPRALALDEQDRLYVVDAIKHLVAVFDLAVADPQGKPRLLFTFGGLGLDDSPFAFPGGIAVDNAGRVYISDRENDRVQVWAY